MGDLKLGPKEYSLKDLVKLSGLDDVTILSWGCERGLIFSVALSEVCLEVGYTVFDEAKDADGAKIVKAEDKILDLDVRVVEEIRWHGEAQAQYFLVKNYDYAMWYGVAPIITASCLLVKNSNLRKFLQKEPEIAKVFNYTGVKKPKSNAGRKRDKRDESIEKIVADLITKKITVDKLKKYKQHELVKKYGCSRKIAVLARDEAIQSFEATIASPAA